MKTKELRALSVTNMEKKKAELTKEIMIANTQISSGSQAKNPGQLKYLKKTIARINTILGEKNKSND